jgi:GTP cyclohydrolase II
MTYENMNQTTSARIPTEYGDFRLIHYSNDRDSKEHLALVMGDVTGGEGVLVRVHSECFTGDVLGSLRCDCGPQLHSAMQIIAQAGRGVIIYLRQEGRGIGLAKKLAAYNLQDQGYDTVDANLLLGHEVDEREYSAAAGILRNLKVASVSLLTNNPGKISQLRDLGVTVESRLSLETRVTAENAGYLATKAQRMHHLLTLVGGANGQPESVANLPADVEQRIRILKADAQTFYEAHGLPFVTVSYAQSLDGSIAQESGSPLQISSPLSMTMTHALRSVHDAVLVGIGTVLSDDPRLTVRLVDGPSPQPVILDSDLRIPDSSRLFDHPRGVLVATTSANEDRKRILCARGARILCIPAKSRGRVDLRELLKALGEMGIRSVMVEGGAHVLTSFLRSGLTNAAVITIAPFFVGGMKRYLAEGDEDSSVGTDARLESLAITHVGPDLVLWAKPAGQ